VHAWHDIVAVENDRGASRRAKRHVQYGALLRGVDPLTLKHGLDTVAQSARVSQVHE